jgi:hypothetical protein
MPHTNILISAQAAFQMSGIQIFDQTRDGRMSTAAIRTLAIGVARGEIKEDIRRRLGSSALNAVPKAQLDGMAPEALAPRNGPEM